MVTHDEFIKRWHGRYLDIYFRLEACSASIAYFVSWFEKRIINMNNGVLRTVSQIKILKSVVAVVTIYMMNNLTRGKFPTDKVFIDKPISFSFPRWVSHTNHVFLLTLSRAVNKLSSFVAFVVSEVSRTIVTHEKSLSRFIVAGAVTKPSFLRRWSFKLRRALFTEVFHITNYSTQCVQII